jgi:hypothetical protein
LLLYTLRKLNLFAVIIEMKLCNSINLTTFSVSSNNYFFLLHLIREYKLTTVYEKNKMKNIEMILAIHSECICADEGFEPVNGGVTETTGEDGFIIDPHSVGGCGVLNKPR